MNRSLGTGLVLHISGKSVYQDLTRRTDDLIVPLFWNYEDITCRRFTRRTGTRDATQHISLARSARP